MSSVLKKRMAEKQKDRVEEFVEATKPRGQRAKDRLESELAAAEAVLEPDLEPDLEPARLTRVAEATGVLAAPEQHHPEPGTEPATTPVVAAREHEEDLTVKVAENTVETPAKANVQPPVAEPEREDEQEDAWRAFVTPPAARGTATLTRRLNIPISNETQAFLAGHDYQLKTEQSRWVINRSELLTAAATVFLTDPDQWSSRYADARPVIPDTPSSLQGRITPDLFESLDLARYTPTGKRAVGPVLAFIVDGLLAKGKSFTGA
jgi:hypothetical protein